MNPARFAQMMKYLTRAKKANPNLSDVFPASKAPIPAKTQNVEDMEAVNQFMLRNPRKNMDEGGSVKFYPKASGSISGKSEIAPGIDVNTRDINYGGTVMYEGNNFYGGVSLDKGKVKFDVTDSDGTTLFKDTLSKDDAVNFIVGLGDPKGEKFQIKTDKDFNNMQVVFRKSFAGGGRIGFDNGGDAIRLKALQADYDKFGKKELNKAAKTLGFKDYSSMMSEKNRNKRNKIKNEITNFGEVLTEEGSRKRSREARIVKEQGIQIKLLEATNNKKFFDPKAFAKENNISLKQVKEEAKKLQRNIYKKRIVEASRAIGKETKNKLDWIPNDSQFSDNALNKLWKSKLIKYEREKIDELFFDAFGRKTSDKYNPKKFLAIKKNLNEYRQLRDAINAKYPNINFELDHPLSKSSLNKLFNATTDQLTRVNVLEADLNNGFKDSLSLQYEKAVQGNNLNKKKAVEKIARDLKLNIGKISDDATNFKYGVKEFQKLNIKDEIRKSLQNLSALNKNFQDYAKNNPELFKTANVSTQQTFTQIDKKTEADILKTMGFKCKFAKADGGRIGLSTGSGRCDDPASYTDDINKTRKNLNSDDVRIRAAAKAKLDKGLKIAKTLPKIGTFLRRASQATLGSISKALQASGIASPVGLAIEGVVEGGIYDYYRGKGYTHDQAYQETFFPGIISGRPEGVPWYGGAESLLEKELVGATGVDEEGKTITTPENISGKVAQYVSALKDQDQVYDAFGRLEQGQQAQRKDIIEEAQADIQDLNRSGTINRINKLMDVDTRFDADTAKQAYEEAVQAQAAKQAARGKAYKDEYYMNQDTTQNFDDKLQKERNKDMLQMFPTPTVKDVQDVYTDAGRGDDLKYFQAQDYKDEIKRFDDYQKQSYFADNFRFEKAGGGIAKLAGVSSGVAPESGPNPQGLLSLKNRVRNY